MRNTILVLLFSALASVALARPAEDAVQSIEFSIIKTSDVSTREGLAFAGGSYAQAVRLNHVAVLVRHPQGSFLFDTGLGKDIDQQFKSDMPWWAAPFFSYGPVSSARSQLDAAGYAPVKRVILSHGHWDHASALVEFPEAEVWVPDAESKFLAEPHSGSVFPSQVARPGIKWVNYQFAAKPFQAFNASLDVFGDGSAVLVPLAGHTPGSVGLYISLPTGRRFLFVGDVVWKVGAIERGSPKFWLASKIVDHDADMTLASVASLKQALAASPGLVIVPAHDAQVHDDIGYFPAFTK
jgi:glyoxylase-like metal-dependent hydrolase (beta-lactamase superfamily II)